MKNNQIVSVSGCYWTGSSAVMDLLSEHKACYLPPSEFALFSYGQFFNEITDPIFLKRKIEKNHLTDNIFRFIEFNKSDSRFPTRRLFRFLFRFFNIYPKNLNAVREGYNDLFGKAYEKKCIDFIDIINKAYQKDSLINDEFLIEVKNILDSLMFMYLNNQTKANTVVLDQFISPAYTSSSLNILPKTKMIFIDRDWRDQYVEVKNLFPIMMKRNSELKVKPMGEKDSDYNISSIDFFINLRKRVENYKSLHQANHKDKILWIKFEDLVLDTDIHAAKIFKFLNLDKSDWKPNQSFFPEKSKMNIGKWKFSGFDSDISHIENRLNKP